jgi:hypothetical protein
VMVMRPGDTSFLGDLRALLDRIEQNGKKE